MLPYHFDTRGHGAAPSQRTRPSPRREMPSSPREMSSTRRERARRSESPCQWWPLPPRHITLGLTLYGCWCERRIVNAPPRHITLGLTLHDDGTRTASPVADGRSSDLATLLLEYGEQSHDDARPAAADRVANRDRPSVDIHLRVMSRGWDESPTRAACARVHMACALAPRVCTWHVHSHLGCARAAGMCMCMRHTRESCTLVDACAQSGCTCTWMAHGA